MAEKILIALVGTLIFWLIIRGINIMYEIYGEDVFVILTTSIGIFSILLTIQSCKDE